MKTQWIGQYLDPNKEYKITTTESSIGKENPWYVTELMYNRRLKTFSFRSIYNNEKYGMAEDNVVRIEEVIKQ